MCAPDETDIRNLAPDMIDMKIPGIGRIGEDSICGMKHNSPIRHFFDRPYPSEITSKLTAM